MKPDLPRFRDVAAITPDPTWEPEPFRLYVRSLFMPEWLTVGFCYYNSKTDMHDDVARIQWEQGEPRRSSRHDDGATGNIDNTGSGATILRRYATEDDVRLLVQSWDRREPLMRWANGEGPLRDLRAEDKAMIRRVVAEEMQ